MLGIGSISQSQRSGYLADAGEVEAINSDTEARIRVQEELSIRESA
jgi:hypothetical protein